MTVSDFTLRTTGGRTITGIATPDGDVDKPVIVCVPGGSQNSRYFDAPGYSLVQTARQNGFTAVALDRPGYGGSDPLPEHEVTFARNAEVLDDAIGHVWAERGGTRPGVVIVSHSIGSAITVHIAAARPSWPLRGIALHGVNVLHSESVRHAWDSMPPGQPVEFTPAMRQDFTYGPTGTYDPGIIGATAKGVDPCPLPELLEISGGWADDAPALAARVEVPVHYVLAEYEPLWVTGAARVTAFAELFTSAAWVDATLMAGVGHNIDHHFLGPALHLRQLAFAFTCVAPTYLRP